MRINGHSHLLPYPGKKKFFGWIVIEKICCKKIGKDQLQIPAFF